ncbi:TetR family transcriptional regulator [Trinickia caryophylli]|uniref:Transcriptional regulator, TetR family n=1 Tax=Trinickia caryophylli TaxID=28094 RepID=A0A1X7GDN3_TRICW|nr:TetR family transcriptional regulator [Trinickia caryophylli]PMS10781.1 TetR/AcrR family transcriptional regulator [Trinickia caryophylli]TRX13843.1 TetR/AcrR family transcriptional regulator [Trinickia caryophylli]WQE15434.1 TetR family transcriptional regulator [Trinickia caryophylli]SMF68276.1 transcriptional regulator, TetR family [Trinickia caryophylli]GLU33830.1 TetR family transcriptional regulator [Trinickia caryophylli]
MRVSREQVAENRQKILAVAGRLFRERGFDGVTVADVMHAAGLTHGGFYGYFKSKDDLIAHTLEHVMAQGAQGEADLVRYAARYLSPAHRDNVAQGCPIAALGAEAARQTPGTRAALAAGLKNQIERFAREMSEADPAAARRAAIGSWAAMVGAMLFARLSDDAALSDEVLSETYAWIAEHTKHAGA